MTTFFFVVLGISLCLLLVSEVSKAKSSYMSPNYNLSPPFTLHFIIFLFNKLPFYNRHFHSIATAAFSLTPLCHNLYTVEVIHLAILCRQGARGGNGSYTLCRHLVRPFTSLNDLLETQSEITTLWTLSGCNYAKFRTVF